MGCKSSITKPHQNTLRYCKLVLLGLDNSGKTSILDIISNRKGDIIPSIGVSPTTLVYNDSCNLVVLDVPGSITQQWAKYIDKAEAIIFVIDCSDIKRIKCAKEELKKIDKLVDNVSEFVFS